MSLTACATSAGSPAPSGAAAGSGAPTSNKTITWAYEQEFSNYNYNTTEGSAYANRVVLGPVLSGFWEFKPDGSLLPNTKFGTYAKIKDDPLTIKYTINPKAVWSDGKPVDCDDMMLAWLAHSGVTGKKGFSTAEAAGYELQNKPVCTAGGRDVTVTYAKQFGDWAAMYGPAEIMPAHIVEQQAGMTKTFVDYASTPVSPDLAKAFDFYNKGWAFNPGQLKKDIIPSSGPYVLDSWSAGQSLTLKANPRWWGDPPKTGTIVVRYIGGTAQAQALQNGEIQAMDPQPQVDIVQQLKAMGNQIKFTTGDQYTFEEFDFNFRSAFKDKTLREAFAKCAPRQQILDNLIKPVNPQAKLMQSRFVYPFEAAYADFETSVGGEKYNTVDIAGAKALLAGRTPTVRIGWRKDPDKINKRRADTLALLQASCAQAGFKIVDAGTPTFFEKEAPGGIFDVAMYAWAGSPVLSGMASIFSPDAGDNYGHYNNPAVSAVFQQALAETDVTKRRTLLKQLDTLLWTDLVNIPLFAFPAVFATAKNVQGMEFNATTANLTWNAGSWSLA
jgi:peptide/nickel transport system substrate-binding protein